MRLVETPEDMKKFEALEKTDDGLKNYENLDSENLSQLGTKGDLRILLDSITFTLTTINDYVLLLTLVMYVFSLLGMSFFAGKMMFDDND